MPIAKAADGTPLHYEVHDYTDPWRKAPTMILQHGFARSGRFWFAAVPYLARFFRVVCPDTRGMGGSVPLQQPLERLTPANCVDDFLRIADHLEVDSFHFVGESIAGGMGLMLAGQHPARVRSLSAIAPAVYANDWLRQSYAVGFPTWEEAVRTLGVEGWVRKSNALARFPADAPEGFLEWYVKEVGRNDVESVAAMTRAAGAVDARPHLAAITAPVLVLYPDGGKIVTEEMAQLLLAQVRDIRVVRIPSPYQMLNLLAPADCAHAILNFAATREGFLPRE